MIFSRVFALASLLIIPTVAHRKRKPSDGQMSMLGEKVDACFAGIPKKGSRLTTFEPFRWVTAPGTAEITVGRITTNIQLDEHCELAKITALPQGYEFKVTPFHYGDSPTKEIIEQRVEKLNEQMAGIGQLGGYMVSLSALVTGPFREKAIGTRKMSGGPHPIEYIYITRMN